MGIYEERTTGVIIAESVNIAKDLICEMMIDGSAQTIDVPVDPRIDIDQITADDPNPKFVNVEVLRSGISKGNNRRYNNNIVKEVNDMIPGSQGFFGHPDPSKYGFEFREPQCIFVGSMIDHMPDGLDRTIGKCYLFRTSQLREWVPKSIAAGNPMTVSINGTGDVMRNGDILDVVHMRDLQSIDWANPGTEGMETSKAMSVVREMDNTKGGNKMDNNNAQEIIKNVTVTEFKAYNPSGYDAVIRGITVQELSAANPLLVKSIEDGVKITEMSLQVGGEAKTVKLTELQSMIGAYEQKITELESGIELAKITEYKNQKISEQVPENLREKISARVTGKTKEEIDKSLATEIEYVRELGGNNFKNMPGTNQKKDTAESDKADILRLFGVKVEEKK